MTLRSLHSTDAKQNERLYAGADLHEPDVVARALIALGQQLAAMRAERDAAVAERDRCWKMREDDNAAMARAGQREAERLALIAKQQAEIDRCDKAMSVYAINVLAAREGLATERARAERYRALAVEVRATSLRLLMGREAKRLREDVHAIIDAALAETPEGK